jgi:hypothetical protein
MKKVAYALLATSSFFLSCEDEVNDPPIPNEEEVITTLTYTLTAAGSVHTFTFQDLDGDGGNAPTIAVDTITSGVSYSGSMILLNEIENEDITTEVFDEAEEHQFFFQSSDPALSVSYSDTDANQQPLGLLSELSVSDPGDYSLTITLRHEPDKSAAGVSDGDITNAGGETDIEVTFQIHVL